MVFKTTGLSSRFQRSKRFWKICIGSRVIGQNVTKLEGLVWRVRFWHVLTNISGSNAYISKLIASLKPLAQADRFEYLEPYKWKTFFRPVKGSSPTFNEFVVGRKRSEIKKFFFPLIFYTLELLFPAGQKDPVKNQYFNPLYCSDE